MKRTKSELRLIKMVVDLYLSDIIEEVEKKKYELRQQNRFGNCSVCGGENGHLNVYKDHYFFCRKHKKCWYVGSNLISGWQDETQEIWKENAVKLKEFEEIDGNEWLNNKLYPSIEDSQSDDSEELPF